MSTPDGCCLPAPKIQPKKQPPKKQQMACTWCRTIVVRAAISPSCAVTIGLISLAANLSKVALPCPWLRRGALQRGPAALGSHRSPCHYALRSFDTPVPGTPLSSGGDESLQGPIPIPPVQRKVVSLRVCIICNMGAWGQKESFDASSTLKACLYGRPTLFKAVLQHTTSQLYVAWLAPKTHLCSVSSSKSQRCLRARSPKRLRLRRKLGPLRRTCTSADVTILFC